MGIERDIDLVDEDYFTVTPAHRFHEQQPGTTMTGSVIQSPATVNVKPEFDIRDGACRGLDPNIFYPEKPNLEAKEAVAIEICRSCVVVEECLEDALVKKENFGIRGGMTARERQKIIKIRANLAKTALKES